jgi:putative intracellular protease/amidase
MLDHPESYRLLRFAGQRVRMVEAIVEFHDRVPCGVARLVYEMLRFDSEGRLDRRTFERQNAALMDRVISEVVGNVVDESRMSDSAVVDASSRFIAQGGRWQPSPALTRRVRQAALGAIKCERL